MAQVVIEMTGDEARLWQSLQKVAGGFGQVDKAVGKTTKTGRDAEREMQQVARWAKKAFEDGLSPAQKYQQRIQQLDRALKANKISEEERTAAIRRAKLEMQGAGAAGQKAFGPAAVGSLRNMVGVIAGGAGLVAAINAVKQAWLDADQARQEMADKIKSEGGGLERLAQLAPTDSAKYGQLVNRALTMYEAGGFGSMDEAAQAMFELESAGLADEYQFFGRFGQAADPGRVAGAAGKVRAALGVDEAGSAQQLVSKALAAATPVSGAGMPDLLEAVAAIGEPGAALGLSDEELFAAVSVASQSMKSASEGGTAVQSLLTSLRKKGFADTHKGRPLQEILDEIAGQGMTEAEQVEYFGRVEAVKGFGLLRSGPYQERLQEVRQAQEDGMAESFLQTVEAQPSNRIRRGQRAAKAREELSRFDLAEERLKTETLMYDAEKAMREKGMPEVGISLAKKRMRLERYVDEESAQATARSYLEKDQFGYGDVVKAVFGARFQFGQYEPTPRANAPSSSSQPGLDRDPSAPGAPVGPAFPPLRQVSVPPPPPRPAGASPAVDFGRNEPPRAVPAGGGIALDAAGRARVDAPRAEGEAARAAQAAAAALGQLEGRLRQQDEADQRRHRELVDAVRESNRPGGPTGGRPPRRR